MKKRVLEVYVDGVWEMVFSRFEATSSVVCTRDIRKALPGDSDTLAYFNRKCPAHRFRASVRSEKITDNLREHHCTCGNVWTSNPLHLTPVTARHPSRCPKCSAIAQWSIEVNQHRGQGVCA